MSFEEIDKYLERIANMQKWLKCTHEIIVTVNQDLYELKEELLKKKSNLVKEEMYDFVKEVCKKENENEQTIPGN